MPFRIMGDRRTHIAHYRGCHSDSPGGGERHRFSSYRPRLRPRGVQECEWSNYLAHLDRAIWRYPWPVTTLLHAYNAAGDRPRLPLEPKRSKRAIYRDQRQSGATATTDQQVQDLLPGAPADGGLAGGAGRDPCDDGGDLHHTNPRLTTSPEYAELISPTPLQRRQIAMTNQPSTGYAHRCWLHESHGPVGSPDELAL